jgi:Ca2+-binding RTX toxin-like protein
MTASYQNLLDAGAGSDTVIALGWKNTIYGDYSVENNGDDSLLVLGGSNYLQGNGGNDLILVAGLGNQVQGNAGNDTAIAAGLAQSVDLGEGNDIGVVLGAGNLLLGGAGNDTLYAIGAANNCFGGFGDDTLLSFSGSGMMYGQQGNDVFLSYGIASKELNRTQKFNDGRCYIDSALNVLNTASQSMGGDLIPTSTSLYENAQFSLQCFGGDGSDTFYSGITGTNDAIFKGEDGNDRYEFYLGDSKMKIDDALGDNYLTIHAEHLKFYGVTGSVLATDMFYNSDTKTLSVVRGGVSYGAIELTQWSTNSTIRLVNSNEATEQVTLINLQPLSSGLSVWHPTLANNSMVTPEVGLQMLKSTLDSALAVNASVL